MSRQSGFSYWHAGTESMMVLADSAYGSREFRA